MKHIAPSSHDIEFTKRDFEEACTYFKKSEQFYFMVGKKNNIKINKLHVHPAPILTYFVLFSLL